MTCSLRQASTACGGERARLPHAVAHSLPCCGALLCRCWAGLGWARTTRHPCLQSFNVSLLFTSPSFPLSHPPLMLPPRLPAAEAMPSAAASGGAPTCPALSHGAAAPSPSPCCGRAAERQAWQSPFPSTQCCAQCARWVGTPCLPLCLLCCSANLLPCHRLCCLLHQQPTCPPHLHCTASQPACRLPLPPPLPVCRPAGLSFFQQHAAVPPVVPLGSLHGSRHPPQRRQLPPIGSQGSGRHGALAVLPPHAQPALLRLPAPPPLAHVSGHR